MLIIESIFMHCNKMLLTYNVKKSEFMWVYLIISPVWTFALNTDVLWQSCNTIICGKRQLNIQCDRFSSILINDVSSGHGEEFDQRSYLNLRRMCLGMAMCEPSRSGFCDTHANAEFNVSYVCVREEDVENDCTPVGKPVTSNIGFITSPYYPAESRFKTCKWRINVPSGHFAHVFLHEVLPISSTKEFCHGLLFMAESTCGKFFPTIPICDESSIDTLISSCSDMDIIMSANSTHSMRFWLSYYVVPVSDLRQVILYDTDITCNTYKKNKIVYRPIPLTTPQTGLPDLTTPTNLTREVLGDSSTNEDSTAVYIGVGVALVAVVIVIVIVVIIFLRQRRKKKPKIIASSSVSNSTDIQKRPLPEFQASGGGTATDPVLHEGYSRVADEISPDKPYNKTYSTYSEIEDISDGGLKPQPKVINRRSIGSSERKLPATPDEEPYYPGYSEIEDKTPPHKAKTAYKTYKDISPSRSRFEEIKAKYEKDNKHNEYSGRKKLSDASNIYAELPDIIVSDEKRDEDKIYVDMTQNSSPKGGKTTNNKGIKDRFNFSKKSQGIGNATKAENTDMRRSNAPRKAMPSWKKDSVTSAESDSDDDLCITENELYEPFESAKV